MEHVTPAYGITINRSNHRLGSLPYETMNINDFLHFRRVTCPSRSNILGITPGAKGFVTGTSEDYYSDAVITVYIFKSLFELYSSLSPKGVIYLGPIYHDSRCSFHSPRLFIGDILKLHFDLP